MPEAWSNTDAGTAYPVKRSNPRKGIGNIRQVKARLGAAGEAVVVDVSECGIGVELALPLQPGSRLAVDFDLPESGGHVRADGRVIWSHAGRRAGIRFERVPDLTSERLKRWVSLGEQLYNQTFPPPDRRPQAGPINLDSPPQVSDETLTLDRAVAQILARAMTVTKATGAAIAIGPPDAMVCQASAGNAPDVGVPIQPNSGLTGYCIRSRATVVCEDTDTDERVNAAACREMELRSALVIPVFSGKDSDELRGILEVFSSQPRAFSTDHISKLEKLTKILGVVASDLVPDTKPETEVANSSVVLPVEEFVAAAKPEPLPESKAAAVKKVLIPAQNVDTPSGIGTVKPAALVAPVVTSQIAARETAVKLAELSKPAAEIQADTASLSIDGLLEKISVVAQTDARLDSSFTPVPSFLPVPNFEVEAPSAAERMKEWLVTAGDQNSRGGRILRVVGLLIIILEIAAAVFLYGRWERKKTTLAKPPAVETPIPVKPAAYEGLSAVPAPMLPELTTAPRHKQVGAPAEDGSDDVVVVNRQSDPSAGGTSAAGTGKASSAGTRQSAAPQAPVVSEKELVAPAPISSQADLAALHLPANPAKPSLAARLSSGTTGGKLLKRIEPRYPDAAKSRGVQGQVILKAHVGPDGMVKDVQTIKGNPLLATAAANSVRQWQYEPMKLNGNPVEMDTTVTVEFKLPN